MSDILGFSNGTFGWKWGIPLLRMSQGSINSRKNSTDLLTSSPDSPEVSITWTAHGKALLKNWNHLRMDVHGPSKFYDCSIL